MNLSTNDLVLLMIHHLGDGVKGRTYVVKMAYFLGELLEREDLEFRAHFYGPYSESVADALGQLEFLGFLNAKCTEFGTDGRGFERCRFDYSITEDGRKAVAVLERMDTRSSLRVKELCRKLKETAGGMTYIALSYAAKTHFVLKSLGRPMTPRELKEEARKLNWEVEPHNFDASVDFLARLGLARVTQTNPA